jgi:hypothetical protein
MKHTATKNYSVIVPGRKPVIIRQTTTVNHAIKHAAYASELRITVAVVDNRTKVTILEIPAIDRDHAIKPKCKRDKRYAKLAKSKG